MQEILIVLKQIWINNSSEIASVAVTLLLMSERMPFMKKIKANGIVELGINLIVAFFKKKASEKK